eukprot:4400327-Lingulodinium_polyedra.AAC.1
MAASLVHAALLETEEEEHRTVPISLLCARTWTPRARPLSWSAETGQETGSLHWLSVLLARARRDAHACAPCLEPV